LASRPGDASAGQQDGGVPAGQVMSDADALAVVQLNVDFPESVANGVV
jgi:hypothetical protein